ncbi:hypothetical protein MKW92_007564 [Papaver armeniacum]|nr:hypothetical protein MKW92_007564 [Papaver armeniacum]
MPPWDVLDSPLFQTKNSEDRYKHPFNSKDKHVFYPVEVRDVVQDTKDKDEIIESEFFDTRESFLSLCRRNHYQFDTLRRAKYSSMMVLYHLHNPTSVAFLTACNMCQQDITVGHGWSCGICPYDVCNSCFQNYGGGNHPHKLTVHPSTAHGVAQNLEARQIRVLQLRYMLDLLVHASQCRHPQCHYRSCFKCKRHASGGRNQCKQMWYLLQIHAQNCKTKSECHVPRCRDLKAHLKRLQKQSDSRHRAAVMDMIRQQATEGVLDKMGHLSVAVEAPAVDTTAEKEDYYPADVVEKMGHLSITALETVDEQEQSVPEVVLDSMDEHQSVDDEWICI